MSKILLGVPPYRDTASALARVAAHSGGRVETHPFDELIEVVSHARRFQFRAVVPFTTDQMKLLEHQRQTFDAFGCKLVCCDDYEVVRIFDDKVRFFRYMDDYGLMDLVPEVFVVQHDGQRIDYADIRYPCIFKLAITHAGNGSTIHQDPSRPLDLDKIPADTDYVVQEYIPGGVEYAAQLYVEGGAVRRSLFYRATRTTDFYIHRGHHAGPYDTLETIDGEEELHNIFASINYTGFAAADLKVVDGRPKVFEINPRLGGTLIRNLDDMMSFLDTACG